MLAKTQLDIVNMEYFANMINSFNEYGGLFALLAAIISILSLRVAIKALNLKCGNKVIGYYNVCSSIDSSTPYIREIVIQNLKDKDVAIQNIYIRFGKNIFIDMFNKNRDDYYTQILPPMGTLYFKFGPAYMYMSSMENVDLTKLIMGKNNGRIILVTNEGKIVVKPIRTGWSPTSEYFKNYGTQLINCHKYYMPQSVYREGVLPHKAIDFSSYGDKIKYLITLKVDGKDIEYQINSDPKFQVFKFNNINFSEGCLQSAENLRSFLLSEKNKGNIQYDSIERIIEIGNIIEQERKKVEKFGSYAAKAEGWIEYYIVDRLQSIWWDIKNDFKNFKQRNKQYVYHFYIFRLLNNREQQ